MKRRMRRLIKNGNMLVMKTVLVLILSLSCLNTATAGEYKTLYDKNYRIIGYSKIDNDREIHYDKNYNKVGHTDSSGVTYDKNYKRTGHEKNGTVYDKNYKIIGYEKKDGDRTVIYDSSFNKKGYEEN